jgi:hypothetical protein
VGTATGVVRMARAARETATARTRSGMVRLMTPNVELTGAPRHEQEPKP